MPPEPNVNSLVSLYWGIGSVVALFLFAAALKKLQSWGKAEILETTTPALSDMVTKAVKVAFEEHSKEEKLWREEERRELRDAIEGMRREFRELERDVRNQIREMQAFNGTQGRPSLRKDDLEKLESLKGLVTRVSDIEKLIMDPGPLKKDER